MAFCYTSIAFRSDGVINHVAMCAADFSMSLSIFFKTHFFYIGMMADLLRSNKRKSPKSTAMTSSASGEAEMEQ